jgi:hypothetical protein
MQAVVVTLLFVVLIGLIVFRLWAEAGGFAAWRHRHRWH